MSKHFRNHPDDYDRWLDGEAVTELAVPFPSQLMAIISQK